ncbi:cellulase family glycosylhydrolase [Aureimonas psammosilenae]|uniref:cellulase family glycosylhydrolase n=1 Tax=Aureimonas psammosilenae TaxID=2495496 RepID=UPI00186AB366|nr:cellulase family glycosylhydrolase [Aureimonas psammosilenae]
MIAINLAGAEFAPRTGVYGKDYAYPSDADLEYYHSKGFDTVRLPLAWERMQPTLFGELDPAEMEHLTTFLAHAESFGMKVIVDLHNYARYDGQRIGSAAVPETALPDFWVKMAGALKGNVAVSGYDLMNEPFGLANDSVWPRVAQKTVDAIRAVDMDQAIYISGDHYSGASGWLNSSNKDLILNDPADNLIYQAHIYFDGTSGGKYNNSYDRDYIYPNIGAERVQPFLDWLTANNLKGFVGEFGVPSDDPRWQTVTDIFLSKLGEYGVSSGYWAGGDFWSYYKLTTEPYADGTDRPTMATLQKHLNDGVPNFDGTLLDASKVVSSPAPDGTSQVPPIVGTDKADMFLASANADDLNGGDGADIVSYVNSTAGVTVDLAKGVGSGGWAEGDKLASFKTVIGSAYDDKFVAAADGSSFYGRDGNDLFVAGAGADYMNGGRGSDTVSYAEAEGGVTVQLNRGIGYGRYAATDTFVSIENVIGSRFNDNLTGDGGINRLEGGDGDDTLIGGGGGDTLIGGAGSDTVSYASSKAVQIDLAAGTAQGGDATGDVLIGIENVIGTTFADTLRGDANANTLSGGAANDVLEGGAGADTLDGGADRDTASYAGSNGGVRVDLVSGRGFGADAEGDKLINIEDLLGSNFDDVLYGNSGRNILTGGDGNDTLEGGGAADTLNGGTGSDTASYSRSETGVRAELSTGLGFGGDAEGDRLISIENLTGSAFDDTLVGDGNANVLDGGAGADTLIGGAGADTLIGGEGVDTASYTNSRAGIQIDLTAGTGTGGDAEGDKLTGIENIIGSNFSDTLRGDAGANSLSGGAGADTLEGGAGADRLDGGGDRDTVSYAGSQSGVKVDLAAGTGTGGDAEGDTLFSIENLTGSAFDDVLTGDGLSNTLDGGAGNDTLEGGAGSDTLIGGAGLDTASYSRSQAAVMIDLSTGLLSGGDAFGDVLVGIENLTGSAFDDTLTGDAGANVLDGGAGNDLLSGGAGADTLIGGAGVDTASYAGSQAGVSVNLATGLGSGGDAAGDRLSGIENLTGSALNDTLSGDRFANTLLGGAGDDTLSGGAGNDTLEGGAGADVLDGGADRDTVSYAGSLAGVSVDLAAGTASGGDAEGDRLIAIENLVGSRFDDTLVGDAGRNVIDGGAGNDTLEGGAGADTLNGGTGYDTASYSRSAAAVRVELSTGLGFGGDAEGDRLTGIENVTGSAFDDTLIGSAGNNTLDGGDGNDTLIGGAGSDMLIGGAGSDTASYAASRAGVQIDLSAGMALGGDAAGDTLIGIENLIGTSFADSLEGDANNNALYGGASNDTLEGGVGADLLDGGEGRDTASYAGSQSGVRVDLVAGQGFGGDAEGDRLISIENLVGSRFDDTLIGDAGRNVLDGAGGNDLLEGGAGADTLNGGAGYDTASYSRSSAGVHVELSTGLGFGGDAEGDRLSGIENLIGSAYDDLLVGGTGNNVIDGGDGNDMLIGGTGSDTLIGGAGIDTASYAASRGGVQIDLSTGTASGGDAGGDTLTGIENLVGSSSSDTLKGDANDNALYGGASNDILEGGAGADLLDGGADRDTASYEGSQAGVRVDLVAGQGFGGDAEGDRLISIENITGSRFDDALSGDSGRNILIGGAGNDTLEGGAGADTLTGGAGIDTASYSRSATGVHVELSNGLGFGGDAEGDRLSGIENLTGSAFDDKLVGDANDNIIFGNGGNDVLRGGAGSDIFVFTTKPGAATIEDFDVAADKIDLSATGLSFAEIQAGLKEYAGGVTLTVSDTTTIDLTGMKLDAVREDMFII